MGDHFFIAGAQRSGTTYLYQILDDHPEIQMASPIRPEPKFFLNEDQLARGRAYYEETYFKVGPPAWLKGEKGTSYIESRQAAARIAEWFPGAKIIFILREPIARAISNYYFSVDNGFETLGIEEAFFSEEQRIEEYDHRKVSASPFAYLRRGRYIDYLRAYEEFFPRKNLIIFLFEEVIGSIQQIQRLYSLLGVDHDFAPPSIDQPANVGRKANHDASKELRAYLEDFFGDANKQLAAAYDLNLDAWHK